MRSDVFMCACKWWWIVLVGVRVCECECVYVRDCKSISIPHLVECFQWFKFDKMCFQLIEWAPDQTHNKTPRLTKTIEMHLRFQMHSHSTFNGALLIRICNSLSLSFSASVSFGVCNVRKFCVSEIKVFGIFCVCMLSFIYSFASNNSVNFVKGKLYQLWIVYSSDSFKRKWVNS